MHLGLRLRRTSSSVVAPENAAAGSLWCDFPGGIRSPNADRSTSSLLWIMAGATINGTPNGWEATVTCLAIALRGLLVATAAAAIITYLLLTKSTGGSSMPWTPNDAERHTHKATTSALKELWAKVANESLERTGNEGRAIREANAVIARQAEPS